MTGFLMRVYSVFDSKAAAFLPPFFCANAAVALRSFTRAVQEEGTDFNRFAADYTLFEVGTWDQSSGEFVSHEAKVSLGCGVEFLAKEVR